jgi:hypothetical protein
MPLELRMSNARALRLLLNTQQSWRGLTFETRAMSRLPNGGSG